MRTVIPTITTRKDDDNGDNIFHDDDDIDAGMRWIVKLEDGNCK